MSGDQKLQADQYSFPYHHLVDVSGETPVFHRQLGWGFEYAYYQLYIRDQILKRGHQTVLDVGCGDGWMVKELHQRGVQASGIDTDARVIQLAQAFCPDAELIAGNVFELDRAFDAVTLLEVLEHIPEGLERDILAKSWDLVAPGGSLYLTVPSTARSVHNKHFRHYDRSTVESLLDAAGVENGDQDLRFLCQDTRLYKFFLKLINNKKCALHIPALNKVVWSHYQKAASQAAEHNGLHVCAVIHKPG